MDKKLKIINKKRFFISIILLLLIFTLIFVVTVYAFEIGDQNVKNDTYIVSSGDTLWDIASEFKGDKDLRTYLYKLKKLNELDTSDIYIGMKLLLP